MKLQQQSRDQVVLPRMSCALLLVLVWLLLLFQLVLWLYHQLRVQAQNLVRTWLQYFSNTFWLQM